MEISKADLSTLSLHSPKAPEHFLAASSFFIHVLHELLFFYPLFLLPDEGF
ncbi:hypothetical protein DL95DRAFT_386580, partial [Leptodontidium sp. 2 PMI_412]